MNFLKLKSAIQIETIFEWFISLHSGNINRYVVLIEIALLAIMLSLNVVLGLVPLYQQLASSLYVISDPASFLLSRAEIMKFLLSQKILRQLRQKMTHKKDAAESRKTWMLSIPLGHETATVYPEDDELECRGISNIEEGEERQKFTLSEPQVTEVRV